MTLKQRIATTAVTAAFLGSILAPVAVFANNGGQPGDYSNYSVEQLEGLIVKLQKLVEEMKKGSTCFVSDKELSIGDGDADELTADVRRLQEFLREKSFYSYKSTGYFGKATRTALVAYQKSVGVAETGIFDAATRAKAHASYCKVVKKMSNEGKKEVKKEEKREEPKGKPEMMSGVSSVKSISLTASGTIAEWTVEGNAPHGFKLLWSKTSGPTYPTRGAGDSAAYFEHPDARKGWLNAFDGAGTYYVRVCEYLGGKAGTCSNEVQVTL